jgi:UDP-N-acetylglucosamine 2-epimerase (non-hydrolysing)
VDKVKILSVFGTRPEAIKMAPLILALREEQNFNSSVVVTGQHRELLDQVLQHFAIVPDYDLDIMQQSQNLYDLTARILQGLETVLAQEKPAMVLVHGDTTTTFAGALAAYYQKIPVGHVEAGLRSFARYFPFPEEINRRLTGVLTDLHFAPTGTSRDNLLREGVRRERILVTGNTAIDALFITVKNSYQFRSPVLRRLDFQKQRIMVLEAHRRENWGKPLADICCGVRDIVRKYPDVQVVFPVHPNPVVKEVAYKWLGAESRVLLVSPLDYCDFANLMNRAYLILTDSGGIQEEAPALGKPVLVLRDVTERPEAVAAGTVKIVGTKTADIVANVDMLLADDKTYADMAQAVNPYGDGEAARRIVAGLKHFFGFREEKPAEFCPKS